MSNEINRDSFVVYRSMLESAIMYDGIDQTELLAAIFKYGLNGEEPTFTNKYVMATWVSMKPNIDNACKKRDAKVTAGAKGGYKSRKPAATPTQKEEVTATETIETITEYQEENKVSKNEDKAPCEVIGDNVARTIEELNQFLNDNRSKLNIQEYMYKSLKDIIDVGDIKCTQAIVSIANPQSSKLKQQQLETA